jgi:hypothetical protein
MTTSKSNVAYNTLISLHDKLTRINGVITPEAVDMSWVEYSRSQKPTITNRARSTDTLPVRFPSKSTDSSSETQHGHTQCRAIQVRTRRQLSALATQPPSKNNMWRSTRSSRRATITTLVSKRQARSSFYTQWATMLSPH